MAAKKVVVRPIPELAKPRRARAVTQRSVTLESGLRVLAVAKRGVPLVEVRLRVPILGASREYAARVTVMTETMLKGTKLRSGIEFEQAVGMLGATLDVGADHDKLTVGGSVLSSNLAAYLDLLCEALTVSSYPAGEVDAERERLVEHLAVANSQAGTLATKARAAALFGDHPYGITLPEVVDLQATGAASLRALHRRRVVPDGAILVLVGDISVAKALDLAAARLSSWTGSAPNPRIPALVDHTTGPLVLIDRPGSVQSAIRVGGIALERTDPDYAAVQVANVIFGGNFSSRLTRNLREDKGYTYTPGSGLDPRQLATVFTIGADVATEVTAPALMEITYELSRMVTLPVGDEELANARDYLIGSRTLALSTQAGLASMIANLEYAGMSLQWLQEQQSVIAQTSAEDVLRAATRVMRPTQVRTAVVGDVAAIESSVRAISDVELQGTQA